MLSTNPVPQPVPTTPKLDPREHQERLLDALRTKANKAEARVDSAREVYVIVAPFLDFVEPITKGLLIGRRAQALRAILAAHIERLEHDCVTAVDELVAEVNRRNDGGWR